jgi:septin family protein
MAINLKTTRGLHASGVKLLVYGQAGTGKTTLITTLPSPVILSAEAGLLSIAHADIPFVAIDSMSTLQDAFSWLTSSDEAKQFESIALDSISEIAEVILTAEKAKAKDPRQAYG